MKCLERNKTSFYYALYEGKTPIIDEYGNETGEFEVIHGKPVEFSANISAAQGEATAKMFGENEDYDKIIAMDKDAPALDIYSLLWIDSIPQLDESGETIAPHDYVVKKVAESLNSVVLAISKVNVSE